MRLAMTEASGQLYISKLQARIGFVRLEAK
jgi:hypothetical protein